MRYKMLIGLICLIGCARSEKLSDDEMQYVKTTIALTNARIASRDSLQLEKKFDSVYRKFGTSKEKYITQTTDFSKTPDRAGIVFHAIADSLNVK